MSPEPSIPSRIVVDACVWYSDVLRGLLLGLARRGLLDVWWSERIAEECLRARHRQTPDETETLAHIEAELNGPERRWVEGYEALEADIKLPDKDDRHVVAAAVHCDADAVVTFNRKDFPRMKLAELGLQRLSPDEVLLPLYQSFPEEVTACVHAAAANVPNEKGYTATELLQRSRATRLARALREAE